MKGTRKHSEPVIIMRDQPRQLKSITRKFNDSKKGIRNRGKYEEDNKSNQNANRIMNYV